MKLPKAFVVFGIGAIIGLSGCVLAGDLNYVPLRVKAGISLIMIGMAVGGYSAGIPIYENKEETTHSS